VVAAIADDVPFRAAGLEIPVDSPLVDELLRVAARSPAAGCPVAILAAVRAGVPADARPIATALLAWAPRFATLAALEAAIADFRANLARLRRDDANLTLATAHATKGLEFDHVAVIGMDEGRFPSARSVAEAEDPARALEEERRLAYVAWTRARRSLTLVYDPDAPSAFLREAFEPWELVPAA
jgi:superfamily I DNA/RNA helicase